MTYFIMCCMKVHNENVICLSSLGTKCFPIIYCQEHSQNNAKIMIKFPHLFQIMRRGGSIYIHIELEWTESWQNLLLHKSQYRWLIDKFIILYRIKAFKFIFHSEEYYSSNKYLQIPSAMSKRTDT